MNSKKNFQDYLDRVKNQNSINNDEDKLLDHEIEDDLDYEDELEDEN